MKRQTLSISTCTCYTCLFEPPPPSWDKSIAFLLACPFLPLHKNISTDRVHHRNMASLWIRYKNENDDVVKFIKSAILENKFVTGIDVTKVEHQHISVTRIVI